MTRENEIRNIANNMIRDNNFDAQIVGIEQEEDNFITITIEVSREHYERVFDLENYFDDWKIIWRQKTPSLIEAKVGDLVLIYDPFSSKDKDSDVGLVSSKQIEENGEVYYGCRYIKIGLNDDFVNNVYHFEITGEDYGGFKTGFLKILTPSEAISFLRKTLDNRLQEGIEDIKMKYEISVKRLPELINSISNLKIIKCDKVELDRESLEPSILCGYVKF